VAELQLDLKPLENIMARPENGGRATINNQFDSA
jgi:hypothetical protein